MWSRIPAICCATILTSCLLFGMSGSQPIAWPDQAVLNGAGWPGGVLELINDPARTEGWNPWFSGWPSDVHYYLFKPGTPADVNRLIQRLAAIQTNVHLKLSPAGEAGALAFTTAMKKGNGHSLVFALGNQRVLDEWRRRAEPVGSAGNSRPTGRAMAMPPTLTLYVGHPIIDLAKLQIPLACHRLGRYQRGTAKSAARRLRHPGH
jgi:hypothetical protein